MENSMECALRDLVDRIRRNHYSTPGGCNLRDSAEYLMAVRALYEASINRMGMKGEDNGD